MSIKIVDNTFISASLYEVKTVDLLQRLGSEYPVLTTEGVFEETKRSKEKRVVENVYRKYIGVYPLYSFEKAIALREEMKKRYPMLGKGEVEAFILTLIICKEKNNEKCYFITDDKKMRSVVKEILEKGRVLNKEIVEEKVIERIYLTGTVGIIDHLYKRGKISQEEICEILKELKDPDNTFRIKEDHLKLIKERCGENKNEHHKDKSKRI